MHRIIIGLVALSSISAFAVTIKTFDIYDDGGEKQPHYLTIEKNNSKVSRIKLFADYKGKSVELFNISAKQLKTKESSKKLEVETSHLISPKLNGSYSSPWGDASIESGHQYSLQFNITNNCPSFLEDEYEVCRIEVSDHEAGEMAMWGSLVQRKAPNP